MLQGATLLLAAGAVKLLKVEFELIPVYEATDFADIDIFMRMKDFQAGLDRDRKWPPIWSDDSIFRGRAALGKALYAPTIESCLSRLRRLQAAGDAASARKEASAAIALYAAARLPGYVCDVIVIAEKDRFDESTCR